jgi:hypothetical protein
MLSLRFIGSLWGMGVLEFWTYGESLKFYLNYLRNFNELGESVLESCLQVDILVISIYYA